MSDARTRTSPRTGLSLAALLGALAVVLLARLGEAPAANPAEARISAAVGSTVATGSWLVPTVRGAPRIEKPPGYAWLASAVAWAAGGKTWTAVRLPAAAATLGLAALLFAWGRSLGGPDLGLLAALCFSAMGMTIDLGRRGVAETMLGFCSALALFAFDRVHYGGRRAALPLFALALALAILAKATAALLLVGLPVALCLALERSLARALRADALAWLALALVAGFAWYAVVLAVVPGAWRTLFAEATVPVGARPPGATATHYAPPYYYLAVLVRATLPVAVLLPLAAVRAVQSRGYRASPRLRFAALAFGSLFVAFSILPQKRTHYLVPLLPLLALLIAESLVDLGARTPERLRRLLRALALLAAPLALGAAAALAVYYHALAGAPVAVAAGLVLSAAALVSALAWSALRGRGGAFAALSAAGVLAGMLAYYGDVDVCRRQVEIGAPQKCRGYDATRWEAAFRDWPPLARFMAPPRRARDA